MAENRLWTRDELLMAIELYLRTPFGKIHKGNPEVIDLAQTLNRTPSSISLKMVNFAALDTSIKQAGMKNYSRLDEEIWNEYFQNPNEFFDQINATSEKYSSVREPSSVGYGQLPAGEDVLRISKMRKNQDLFRLAILASYDFKCAITGLAQTELLVASHIMPWSESQEHRTNLQNGICLNALHDKAFDKGLITISSKNTVVLCKKLKQSRFSFFIDYEDKDITLPHRFAPNDAFLEYHRNNVFLDR